jgi:hypothetical protein
LRDGLGCFYSYDSNLNKSAVAESAADVEKLVTNVMSHLRYHHDHFKAQGMNPSMDTMARDLLGLIMAEVSESNSK